MEIDHLLERLRADHTSGAMALLEQAMAILETFLAQPTMHDQRDLYTALVALVRALIAAQPSMAPMLNLAHQMVQACPADLACHEARQRLHQALNAFRQQVNTHTQALCAQTLAIIPPQATVLTYSNSGTVIAALQHAHQYGRLQRVILSESRPAYDGRLQAQALLQLSIPVEYGIDMALFERLPEAHLVLVGADAILPHGVVNKLGTHTLAQVARLYGIPVFSLCTSHKFLPAAATPLLHIADHPSDEIWPAAPSTLRIRNRYFDTTPLPLFSGIICERGIYAPAALQAYLQHLSLSPALL